MGIVGRHFNNLFSHKAKLPNHFHDKKTIKNNQIQQTDFNCFEEHELRNLISELENKFNYNDDYDKNFPIYIQLWEEINKSDGHRNYVLLEAQANKGKRSDALCCFLVDQEWWGVRIIDTKDPSKIEVLDDVRRNVLREQAIRKLLLKGVQDSIDFIVAGGKHPPDKWADKEKEKQEDILSIVCYVLGLTANKKNGAKERLGQDAITSTVSNIVNKALHFLQQKLNDEHPDQKVTHKIVDSYYRCYSDKEKLPSAETIDNVVTEIANTIRISSNPHDEEYHTLLDDCNRPLSIEASTYNIISKAILHPIISKKYTQRMNNRIKSESLLQPNEEKKEYIIIGKEYLATDETHNIKSSQFYKDIEGCLLTFNSKLTENEIFSCAKDYHKYFCKVFELNVPSLAALEPFQPLSIESNKRRAVYIE